MSTFSINCDYCVYYYVNINKRLQPNAASRQKQLEAWCSFVLAYHKHHKIYHLDLTESQSSPIFYNQKISRKLSTENIQLILEELQKKGHIEYKDKSKQQCLILWRTAEEWAKMIYQWANSRGMVGTVCTFYELQSGEDTVKEGFHDLDKEVLMKALKCLESQHKAEIMIFDGNEGVKFL